MSELKEKLAGFWRSLLGRSQELRERTQTIFIEGTRTLNVSRTDLSKRLPRSLEPMALAQWSTNVLQGQGTGFYGKLITILMVSYFLADLSAMMLGNYIPEPPVARQARLFGNQKPRATLEDYNPIFARNLFSSQGLIPGEESTNTSDPGGAPTRSTLPLNLIGTLILRDELRSIATIEDKTASQIYPVRSQDEIPSKVRILTVEPNRVIFVNLSSNRREFIDMPQEGQQMTIPRITPGKPSAASTGPGIEKLSPTQFNVSRTEVDKALANINQVLTQARAVPNFENGQPAGYKLFQIVPGSIYDKLGLQNGDTLSGLNGQSINDPAKAFELLGELKSASHLELQVKREGRASNFVYDIR